MYTVVDLTAMKPNTTSKSLQFLPFQYCNSDFVLADAIETATIERLRHVVKNLSKHDATVKELIEKELLVSEDQVIVRPKGEKDEWNGPVIPRHEHEDDEEEEDESSEDSEGGAEEDGESETESHGAPEATTGSKRKSEAVHDVERTDEKRLKVSSMLNASPKKVLPPRLRARYAICANCDKEYDVTENAKGSCTWHEEETEVDDEYFGDRDEDCDSEWHRKEYPKGFLYMCCGRRGEGLAEGCRKGRHQEKLEYWERLKGKQEIE